MGNGKWTMTKKDGNVIYCSRQSWTPLITFSREYSKVNAYNLALFADLAYSNENTILTYFKKFQNSTDRDFKTSAISASPFLRGVEENKIFTTSLSHIFSDSKTDTQFFFATNPKQLLISIRGTELELTKLKDLFQDVKAEQIDFSNNRNHGQVHKGFFQCFSFVSARINKYLESNYSPDQEIIITGHSLGGAIATLLAAYLSDHPRYNIQKIMLYTFGSPRVGNKTFYTYFSKKIVYFRCVNNKDLVANLPLPGMDLKANYIPLTKIPASICLFDFDFDLYTHLGTKVLVHILSPDNAVVYKKYDKKIFTHASFNTLPSGGLTVMLLMEAWKSIKDHSMSEYFKFIKTDLIKSLRLYPKEESDDLSSFEQEIELLKKEIRDLEEEIADYKTQAQTHEKLAMDPENHDIKSFHQKEAADLRYKYASINTVIKTKEVDLANIEATYNYYKTNGVKKKDVISDLLGTDNNTTPLEQEIKYHLENW